ncbi:MAG TPA: hypothetical protein VE262_09205 [Blastocatellia bacterium]|nr:hypothetical protein [Blastocatellia bacterium]
MQELKAVESKQAKEANMDPRAEYYVFQEEGVSLKPGDEVLLMVGDPNNPARERYGFAVRVSDRAEPEEDEKLIQYGEEVFVAQKLPEFI